MTPVKVGILVDKIAPEYVGGYENRIWYFAQGLSLRHEVRVYSSRPGTDSEKGENPGNFGCHPHLARRRITGRSMGHTLLFSAGLLADPISNWNPDVMLVEAMPYIHLYSMRRWIKRRSCPKVLDVPEAWASYRRTKGVLSGFETWTIRKLLGEGLDWSDRAIVPSIVTARSLVENYRYDAVDIIPTGVPQQAPGSDPAERDRDATYDFVTVGRASAEKRQSDLLGALGILKNRGWKGRALIIGQGPETSKLVDLARKLGISAQLDFAGLVGDHVKLQLLSRARVFVLCSEREGQSIATLEAVSCGLPAIVARPRDPEVFAAGELVTENLNGFHYAVGNVGELSAKMSGIISDVDLRLRFAKASLDVARRFDISELLARLEHSLRSLTGTQ